MSQRISRRELARRGLVGMAILAAPKALLAQTPTEKQPPIPAADLENIEKQLAKPMPEAAKKLLDGAVKYNRGNGRDRMKFKIADGYEPAAVYFAKAAGGDER